MLTAATLHEGGSGVSEARGFLGWKDVPHTWRGQRPGDGPHKIYALVDPRDDTVRYVGVTRHGLGGRLARHLENPTNQHTARWLDELATVGMRPDIRPICGTEGGRWEQAEMYWIAWFRERARLLNVDPGGEYRTKDGKVRRDREAVARRMERIVRYERETGLSLGPPLKLRGRGLKSAQPPPRFHDRPKIVRTPTVTSASAKAAVISARQMRRQIAASSPPPPPKRRPANVKPGPPAKPMGRATSLWKRVHRSMPGH